MQSASPRHTFCVTNCTLVTSSDVASALKPPKVKESKPLKPAKRKQEPEQKRRMNEGNK